MKKNKKISMFFLLLLIFSASRIWPGTTGKIDGTITDKATGEPMFGASLIVVGTSLGAATDINGHYTVLYVPPGTYSVQITYIGYNKITVNDIKVHIDQTTRIDLQLEPQTINIEELVVYAKRTAIKKDVATSVTSITGEEIKELPITSLLSAIGLQAGISGGWGGNPNYSAQPQFVSNYQRGHVSVGGGLSIRGGEGDNILFMVDGVTMRDPRNNEPITQLPMSSVKEVSVERGGFNAEYGQVRSGIVNVVTREGDKSHYYGSFQVRMTPPQAKYFKVDGNYDLFDPMSYALRPFYDDAVCWTGTGNGAWDTFTKKQYPDFIGWNEISRIYNTDDNPNNDLTPIGAQRVFMYETRKKAVNNQPDYDIDAGFGGPVPFVGDMLGNLRFFASYRGTRDILIVPLTRPDYRDYNFNAQAISDITPSLKLKVSGGMGKQYSIRSNWDGVGGYSYPHYPNEIAGAASAVAQSVDLLGLFSDYNFSLSDIGFTSLSGKITHTIDSKTFYEVSIENFNRDYNTRPTAMRDTSQKVEVVTGFFEDSNPFGYWPTMSNGVAINNPMHASRSRDFTKVGSTTFKVDFTSQVNFENLMKAGIEFNYNDLNFDYGIQTTSKVATGDPNAYDNRVKMHVFPYRGSAYIQNKLEAEGFTLNAGLRLDYYYSNSQWWDLSPYDVSFFSSNYNPTTVYPKQDPKGQWQLSPRLGIAHPISENVKLFFNYGHFKQIPQYESLFRVLRSTDQVMQSFGNPNTVQARTISYELGIDYLIYDDILLQAAAFYNDISNQQDFTTINSVAGFNYTVTSANNYQDTRGFEVTLRKTSGIWWSGFVNYTYQVNTTGHFGSSRLFQSPSEQKKWDEATINLYQDRPIPQPNARANINFFTPKDFGPEFFGQNLIGGWGLNIVLNWNAGYWTTWNPKNIASIAYNVQSEDYLDASLRFQKTFDFGSFNIHLFMDVNNLLNTKRLWNTNDQDYMLSLHLPKSDAYDNIPGDDKVGAYRKPGAEFTPMVYQAELSSNTTGLPGAIYYEGKSGGYFEYINSQWVAVDQERINKIMDDKSYIDMPNASTFWFLNPRNFSFGLRLSFNL